MRKYGIAFLAATFVLEGNEVRFRPRMNPLKTADGAFRMAVVRIESSATAPPAHSDEQRQRLTASIVQIARTTRVRAVQIDFDARKSEREFYRALIEDVRRGLGRKVFLSMTALASWCEERNWLAGFAADEAVPMIFRMGPEGPRIRDRLMTTGKFPASVCRTSVGIDTPERAPVSVRGFQRVYVFWYPGRSREWLRSVLAEVGRK